MCSRRREYYVADIGHDMYWDDNIDPYRARNVTCRQMYADRREFSALHAPVPQHMTDKSRMFRPLDRGHGRLSRDSSCSRDSRPKSRGSSRSTSRASAANFARVGDFMKKFADDASSRERRLVEEAWQREEDLRDMAVEREKEIRAYMKQLAASEARVAALEPQLQDQARLKNPRGNVLSHREQAYFPDLTTQPHARPWYPSPVLGDSHIASVPTRVRRREMYDFTISPSSLFDDTMYASINLNACHGVSTDTATVFVVKARASVPTFGGPQQSLECPTVRTTAHCSF